MKNFIPVVRAQRLTEMKMYTDKGYSIQNRKHYIMQGKITIPYADEIYEYEIRVTQDEVYFYIIRNNACVYLSIAEIYDVIRDMDGPDRLYFIECLKRQLRQRDNGAFYYQGLAYKMKNPVIVQKLADVNIPQTGFAIMNRDLFLLIIMIQEKSNALFRRSTVQKRTYVNGIIRLLIVLLEEKDNSLLQQLGWKWNSVTRRFTLETKESRKGRDIYKYYLTQKEYDANMNLKKS